MSKVDTDWINFKILRNSFSSLFRKKKSDFYKNIIKSESTSSNKLWRKLDPYLNPNKISKVSPSLIINDTYYNTPADIALTFSNFFSSVTNNFSFLNRDSCSNFITNHFSSISSLKHPLGSDKHFNFIAFNCDEVVKAFSKLRSSSAAGFVGIETRVLKECASELGNCFTDLFNLCLLTGTVPDEWKVAFLTPIYKG